ncbi:hypothetical protein TrRE_jg6983, partial [Triparma retinervis]
YSDSASQSECASCEAGKFQSDEAKESCNECQPGHFCPASYMISTCTPTSKTECGDCLAGTVSTGGTVTECTSCTADGEYSDTDLASFCKTAKAGHIPTPDRTTLVT